MEHPVDENNYPLFDGLVGLKQKPMKTAMQELIERLDKTEKQLEKENNLVMSSALFAAKNMALEALEKEKEQIINAYEDGYEACDMDEAMEVNKKLTSGDLYYNMNYNQNK
jgi:vacuolar-type H+-ATPase subunit E/Vma4